MGTGCVDVDSVCLRDAVRQVRWRVVGRGGGKLA
jgi:hypothetical protein